MSRIGERDGNSRIAKLPRVVDPGDHLGLIHSVIAKWKHRKPAWLDEEDLYQAGFFGLDRACRGFRPELGWKFSTYAWRWIAVFVRREIQYARSGTVASNLESLPQLTIPEADLNGASDRHRGAWLESRVASPDGVNESQMEAAYRHHARHLGPRDYAIGRRRFLEGATFETIAGEFRISNARAQQIIVERVIPAMRFDGAFVGARRRPRIPA